VTSVVLTPTPVPVTADASRRLMGGLVSVHLRDSAPGGTGADLGHAAEQVLDRIEAWARRLSRFVPDSELSRLNATPDTQVTVGPTMTAVLDWARVAEAMTDGMVDVSMLDARLAAEDGTPVHRPVGATRRWSLAHGPRGSVLRREPGVRFDLDGVAKGWLADRALAIAPGDTALVDGDGDIAARVAPGDELLVGVADPRDADASLAVVRLAGMEPAAGSGRPTRYGLATSGTSVHRWVHGTTGAHHLIDPLTWRPADTDVVQATVLGDTARVAEAAAKAAVLAGSDRAPAVLDRTGIRGALLLTTRGELRATPGMLPWLA
jgi:thiamine biosynthesis lipoprotein